MAKDETPEEAYARAEALIARAKEEKWTKLDLRGAPTGDFEGLSYLPSGISDLISLQGLFLSNTQVQDIDSLRNLTALETLYLDNTEVRDINPLRKLTALRTLYLRNTPVRDIEPLQCLTALGVLLLSNTQVQDIDPLRSLTALVHLDLDNTQVRDIAPLRSLTGLTRLYLNNSHVQDLRYFIDMEGWGGSLRWFRATPATNLDPHLKDLSEIENHHHRTEQTLAYLKTLGDDWPPAPGAPIDAQNPAALTFGTDAEGRVALNTAPTPADLPPQAAMLHHLLRGQAAELREFCTTPNREHDRVCGKLSRYLDALGPGPDAMAPAPVLWMAGNDLRNILKADGAKTGEEMGEAPPLGPDRRADLTGLVQTHNAFAALHPDMSQLDHDAIDPVDRVFGAQDRDALHAMVRVLEAQIAMLTDQVRADLASLDAAARGNASGAERALSLESESLHNLVKLVAAEVVIEVQSRSQPRLRGEIRAALIGAGVGVVTTNATVAPVITQNLPELLLLLKPYAATLLSCWQGNTGNLATVMDWVELRLRGRP